MFVSAPTQVRALAKAVATAFAAATLTDEERHPRKITHTDLPWACPPLITDLAIEGVPLQDYLDAPIDTDAQRLFRFWVEATRQLWHEPSRVLRQGVYAALGQAMPKVKLGQRALRFSAPQGAPAAVDMTAAVTLALEVAHTAYVSLPVSDIVSDDDSYIVDAAGYQFGVRGGRPIIPTDFDFDASGMVQDLLRAPRGEMTYACHYDQIAALRSVLHEHRDRFPYNFEAMDTALQALRYLTIGGHCPELTKEIVAKPMDVMRWKEMEAALRDALDTIRDDRISDRSKLQTLHSQLVPAVLSESGFKREIFSTSNYPFAMAPGKTAAIEASILALYKTKIPQGLQRPI